MQRYLKNKYARDQAFNVSGFLAYMELLQVLGIVWDLLLKMLVNG